MGVYVEIDDILDLFGSSDWEINAKETITEAWLFGNLPIITISDEELQRLKGTNYACKN